MSDKSAIEWTDASWNPVRGCVKVSPGCDRCYAETFAERWRGVAGHPYEQGFDLRLVPEKLGEPLSWKRPRRIFVNSMSDLFQKGVPPAFISRTFGVMAAAPQHTFQLLTKRPGRAAAWFRWADMQGRELVASIGVDVPPGTGPQAAACAMEAGEVLLGKSYAPAVHAAWPLPNVQMGVSVEDRKHGLPRIDHLRLVPAAVRFLSIEPLLEDLGAVDLTGISWVIVGSESGHGARPMNEDWVRSIRDQCAAAGIAFFYKQRTEGRRVVSLPVLDGRQHAEFPAVRS